VVLGRHGEAGGSWSGRTVLTWAGVQRLSQTLTSAVLDRTGSFTGTPERVVASGLLVGAPVPLCSCAGRYAVTTSPLPGLLVGTGVGPDLRSVTTDLAATLEGVPVPSAAR
jgi:hypothetical protein